MDKGERAPKGYKRIPLHICFYAMHDLRRKESLVAGGHLTDPPAEDAYSGVVSLEILHISMFIAMKHFLQTVACYIGNAYLEAKPNRRYMPFQVRDLELTQESYLCYVRPYMDFRQ